MEQRGALAAMQALETKSDDELLRETRFKAAAQAILGARAAERYDAVAARTHFRTAIAAARPQERLQLQRMANASLALAERRPDDLKRAVQALGQEPPSGRQLLLLRVMGLLAPPANASTAIKARGFALIAGLILALILVGFLLVQLIALPFGGGVGIGGGLILGIFLVVIILGVLTLLGRRRQKKALAARAGPPA
ncbi:MAG: hypothetical protein JWN65_1134 [Solirubrobacterales bacterium]|nr:hypothetical protein [Solirubrobacterales bacterium]